MKRNGARRLGRRAVMALVLASGVWFGPSFGPGAAPRELGAVRWLRDFDGALAQAAADGRPLFLLFQEIPGCATCVSFGEQVLANPLLVEAIETEFVPVLVHNNRSGRDAELLARYGEPAWNNPVVRFLDAEGRDLIPRRAGVWEPHAIGARMVGALEARGRPVPRYLLEVIEETRPHDEGIATFGMDCYWSGEACLGGISGVLGSRTGFLDGSEVVELRFDAEAIGYGDLLREARRRGCADRVFTHDASQLRAAREAFGNAAAPSRGSLREASARDQKYHLRRSDYGRLELTPGQAVRVNAALAHGLDPRLHLSPRQRSRR